MVIKCPNCNHYVSDTASICPNCSCKLKDDVSEESSTLLSEESVVPVTPPFPPPKSEETMHMPPTSVNQQTIPVYDNQQTTPIYNNQIPSVSGQVPQQSFNENNPDKALYWIIGILVAILVIMGIIFAVQSLNNDSDLNTNKPTAEQVEIPSKQSKEETRASIDEAKSASNKSTRNVSTTPQEYVYLSGVLNVEAVEFQLYHDYGNTYRGTFYNSKLGLTMKVEGEFVDGDYFRLYSTDQKTTWTFACNYRRGEFSGTASNGHGANYNMSVK